MSKLLEIVTAAQMPVEEDEPNPDFAAPSDFVLPESPLSCDCSKHYEKIDADFVIKSSAKQVFETLFGTASAQFWTQMDKNRDDFNRIEGAWTNDELPTKSSSVYMKMDNPMLKLKEFEVKCNTTILKKQDYLVYVVETKSSTPQVPYGDCFTTDAKYCITYQSPNSCKVYITSEVVFSKSTMMKSIIKSNAVKGLTEKAVQIQNLLLQQLEKRGKGDPGKLAEISSSLSTRSAIQTTSSSTLGTLKIIGLLCVSFLLGFFIARYSYSDVKTSIPKPILDWKRELRITEPSNLANT